MKEKLAIEDIVNLFYTNRRQAEIANIHPSTLCIAINNPDWTSSKKHMQQIARELERELSHSANVTEYPEHRKWVQATLKYMKTMELFDHDA